MVITFPRELPDVAFVPPSDIILREGVTASPSGRLINYTNVLPPTWEASLVTRRLVQSQLDAVEAWWLSLRGGLRRVLWRNPLVCYPKAHWSNHAPADQAGALAGVVDGNVLSVTGVHAGLVLGPGDRIGLERDGRYYLGMVSEASGAGANRTVAVEPPPFATVAQAGAVVRFAKPGLVMRPVPGSFEKPRAGRLGSVSFKLMESA